MVVLGCFFLFPGFFISVDDMPISIRWVSYIMPTHYALRGYLTDIFSGKSFTTPMPGYLMSGDAILSQLFHIETDENKWGNLGYTLLFALAIRVIHWAFRVFRYRNYGHKELQQAQ